MKKLLLLALLASPAFADAPGPYGGLHFSAEALDPGVSNDANLDLLGAQMGFRFTPFLAVEGRAAFGLGDDKVNTGGTSVKVELKHQYGLYLLPQYPVSDFVSVYGLLGWTQARAKASFQGRSDTGSQDDLSYGAGLTFAFSRNANLFIEYAQLLNKDQADLAGLAVGVSYHF
ncbi:porin family protein [Gallaecimonas kandeliae]|uniref:porin family protein n=1 Tax=Gallaecimonas kandeliae TaxID=3029055 RepID=UPI002647E30D|nr:porin family protein [Gallaecimonas kandeliae]WKE64759.1 porin family protein [Gallaecimonas kandeliae]